MVTSVVPAKESLMINSAYGSFKKVSEIRVMVCLLIVCTLYWLCGVFIYGSVASSRCDFNASLGNASMLSNVGFDGPPTIYTVGLITV